ALRVTAVGAVVCGGGRGCVVFSCLEFSRVRFRAVVVVAGEVGVDDVVADLGRGAGELVGVLDLVVTVVGVVAQRRVGRERLVLEIGRASCRERGVTAVGAAVGGGGRRRVGRRDRE